MQKATVVAGAVLFFAAGVSAGWFENCDEKAPRRVATPASGITKIIVEARAGSLEVTGRQGTSEVVAAGTACSSDEDFVKEMNLRMRRSGTELYVEAIIPQRGHNFFPFEARLDFEVTVPAGIPIAVHDSSGWMKITNVGQASIDDSSGEIQIRGVRGNLDVHDSSGAVEIEDVSGDVTIEDGSGAMTIERVGGAVHVEDDGSGAIAIRNVKRDVTIDEDGSGGVLVADVGGNFTVRRKGSGHVEYERISGRVSVPRD